MKPDKRDEGTKPEPAGGETGRPEVYAINRERSGWSLSRRSLVSAAAAAGLAGRQSPGAGCATGALAHGIYPSPIRLAIGPDGRMLVSGYNPSTVASGNATIKLWSLPDGALLKRLTVPHGATSLAISPDGVTLFSGTWSYGTEQWSLPDGAPLKAISGSGAYSVAFSPDGRLLATGLYGNIWLTSVSDLKLVKGIRSLPAGVTVASNVTSLAFSADGRLLASGSNSEHVVQLWSVPDGALVKALPLGAGVANGVAFSPDGRVLVSGGSDLILWSLPDGVQLKGLAGHAKPVNAVAVSADGRLLATGSDDQTVKLWSMPDGALLKSLTGHAAAVSSVAITPDCALLASASGDGSIKLWSLPDGKSLPVCLMDPTGSEAAAKSITYTMDGVTYTIPAGSPIPVGAVCTCNSVAGSVCSCLSFCTCQSYGGGGGVYFYPN